MSSCMSRSMRPVLGLSVLLLLVGRSVARATDVLVRGEADVPADFVVRRHSTEEIVVSAPNTWRLTEQPFRRQNDVIVGLFPPGENPAHTAAPNAIRLYIHAHEMPEGIKFEQFVRGHERGLKEEESQTIEQSDSARVNDLPAHRWITTGVVDGVRRKELTYSMAKGQTVYHAVFRAPEEQFQRHAPVVEQIIASLKIGRPGTLAKGPLQPAVRPAAEWANGPSFTLVTHVTMPGHPGSDVVSSTRFAGRWAAWIDADGGFTVFDLEKRRWYDSVGKAWTSLKQAESWAESRRQAGVSGIDPEGADAAEAKRITSALMSPNFKIDVTPHGITLDSDVMTFDVAAKPVPNGLADAFFAHQRLDVYKQAMADRKVPYPLLALIRELEARKLLPESVVLTVRAKGKEHKVQTTVEIQPPDPDQRKQIQAVLLKTGGVPADATGGEEVGTRGDSLKLPESR